MKKGQEIIRFSNFLGIGPAEHVWADSRPNDKRSILTIVQTPKIANRRDTLRWVSAEIISLTVLRLFGSKRAELEHGWRTLPEHTW